MNAVVQVVFSKFSYCHLSSSIKDVTTNSYETTTIPYCPDGAFPHTTEITSAITISGTVTTTTESKKITTQEMTPAEEVFVQFKTSVENFLLGCNYGSRKPGF